jgi:predicted amidohydrolase YtcJ
MLLRNARVTPGAQPVDLMVGDGVVAAIGRDLLPVGVAAEALDLDGRAVIPGLWDHHVHFDQWTMVRRRIDLGPATSAVHAAAIVGSAIGAWTDEIVAGYGFRAALWPDAPALTLLDGVTGERATVLASGDLHSAWLNSAALRRFGIQSATGLLVEQSAMEIFGRLSQVPEAVLDGWADEASRAAAARGVVGIVDLESPFPLASWQRRIAAGNRSLRVVCGVWTSALDAVISAGRRTGDVIAETGGLLEMGPFKVITDGSLNSRTAFCHDVYPGTDSYGLLLVPPEELTPLLARAHCAGLTCAVHAIGDQANSLALGAFAATSARGSIEHAQLLSAADIERFAELTVTASVQPEHAMDDRDVADQLWNARTDRAFVLRSLFDAGARVALGSDAPVAPLDPWLGIAAAVTRARDDRPSWHPEQQISVAEALAASVRGGATAGAVARIAVGAPADLVVLDADPYTADPVTLREMPVAATMLAGRWTFADRADPVFRSVVTV